MLISGLTLSAYGQGALTPPGAPAASMKTLSQIEPRIPISQPSYTCNVAGASYYLTTNLVAAGSDPVIQVATNSITLDLGGFSILGQAGTGNGISIYKGSDYVVVRNGTIRDCYHHGIYANLADHCTFEDLRIIGNGRASATYDGLDAGGEARVLGCRLEFNGGTGLVLGEGGLVRDCLVSTNTDGVVVSGNSQILHNTITHNGDNGLKLTGTGSYVADNIVRDNADNYDLVKGNHLNLLLSEIPETLDWPCTVTLAGTLTMAASTEHGITVATNDVTIDLAGHALRGPGTGSGAGIYQNAGLLNLAVRNGTLSGWQGPIGGGVIADGMGILLEGLLVSSNKNGVVCGMGAVIRDCVANFNANYGIYADDGSRVSDCSVSYNGFKGLYVTRGSVQGCTVESSAHNGLTVTVGTIRECSSSFNGLDGISLAVGVIENCVGYANSGDGISVTGGGLASKCTAMYNREHGIHVVSYAVVDSCLARLNGDGDFGAGIYASNLGNQLKNNWVNDNDVGIKVDGTGNFLANNTASKNATNWVVHTGNICLIVTANTNSVAVSGDAGGTAPGSTDPSANFTL